MASFSAVSYTLPGPSPWLSTSRVQSLRRASTVVTLSPRPMRTVVRAAVEAPPVSSDSSLPVSPSGIVLVDGSESRKVFRLKSHYLEKVVPRLKEEFSYANVHQIPKITKIVVNCGMGDAEQNSKGLESAIKDLATITGQRPVKTRAKESVATFKIKEGATVGIAVTLRRNIMYAFLDRLINLGLPRTRDFLGVNPNSFDGHGNYSLGISDQSVFPEIDYEAAGKQQGMDVCISTTAQTDKEAQRLLALMGMPFKAGASTPTVVVRKKKKKAHHFANKTKSRR